VRWIRAEEGCIVGLHMSHFVNREEEYAVSLAPTKLRGMPESGIGTEALSGYMNRDVEKQNPELGHHLLIPRGLPVTNGAELARLLDARERKKDRTYRRYGGQMPRVACHAIIIFQWGMTDQAAIDAMTEHAYLISDKLRVPLEAQIHYVKDIPDHFHVLIGTRIVEDERLGRKQRQLDAVSEKHDGTGLSVGGKVLGATLEELRADWAERMRAASSDHTIDHRSYARRGVPVYPVTTVPRSEIEWQKRRGREDWRHERRRELRDRAAVLDAVAGRQAQDSFHVLRPTETTTEQLQEAAPVRRTLEAGARVPGPDREQATGAAEPLDPPVAVPVAAVELDALAEEHVVDDPRGAEDYLDVEAMSLPQQGGPPASETSANAAGLDRAARRGAESSRSDARVAPVASPARATSELDPISIETPAREQEHGHAPGSSGHAIGGVADERLKLRDAVLGRIAAHVGALAPRRPEPQRSPFMALLDSLGLDPVAAAAIEPVLFRASPRPERNRQDSRKKCPPAPVHGDPAGLRNSGAEPTVDAVAPVMAAEDAAASPETSSPEIQASHLEPRSRTHATM